LRLDRFFRIVLETTEEGVDTDEVTVGSVALSRKVRRTGLC